MRSDSALALSLVHGEPAIITEKFREQWDSMRIVDLSSDRDVGLKLHLILLLAQRVLPNIIVKEEVGSARFSKVLIRNLTWVKERA